MGLLMPEAYSGVVGLTMETLRLDIFPGAMEAHYGAVVAKHKEVARHEAMKMLEP